MAQGLKPPAPAPDNGHKVAVWVLPGGPHCAGALRALGYR
jgi:hypothetical protein